MTVKICAKVQRFLINNEVVIARFISAIFEMCICLRWIFRKTEEGVNGNLTRFDLIVRLHSPLF